MAIFGGKPPAQLTLTEAIVIGFRMVLQPNFVIPILVIGLVVNLVVIVAFVPLIANLVLGGSEPSGVLGGAMVLSVVGGVITGIIGGLILNLYGQVWATMASVGDAPTMQAAFARVGTRWMSILGAGLIAGAVSISLMIVGGIVAAVLGPLGVVILLAAAVAAIYLGARLSLSGWLAADGAPAMEAVRASWAMTQGRLLLIVGWGIGFAIVFGIVGSIVSAVLGWVPVIGPAISTTVVSAFGFGAGVCLYRKVKGS